MEPLTSGDFYVVKNPTPRAYTTAFELGRGVLFVHWVRSLTLQNKKKIHHQLKIFVFRGTSYQVHNCWNWTLWWRVVEWKLNIVRLLQIWAQKMRGVKTDPENQTWSKSDHGFGFEPKKRIENFTRKGPKMGGRLGKKFISCKILGIWPRFIYKTCLIYNYLPIHKIWVLYTHCTSYNWD